MCVSGRFFVRDAGAGQMGDLGARSCCACRWDAPRVVWTLAAGSTAALVRVATAHHPLASMLNSDNFVERFLVEQACTGVVDAAEAVGHLRSLVTDFDRVVVC